MKPSMFANTVLASLLGVAAPAALVGDGAVAQSSPGASAQVTTLTDTIAGAVGGVTVDGLGYVYVADFGEKVWKVSPWGETTLFTSAMYGASGNAIDSKGNLVQSNFYGNFVARVSRDGEVRVLADGLKGPVGVAIDPDDNAFVTNCNGNSISRITPEGEVTEFAKSDLLNCPNGIAFGPPQGTLYVVNFSDGRMLKLTPEGEVEEFALVPGGGNGHVAFASGTFYVTGFRSNRIYAVTLEGAVSTLAGTGESGTVDGEAGSAQFASPNGIGRSPRGNALYVNDYLTPFPQRGQVAPRSIVRKIQLPSLTQEFLAALGAGGIDEAVAAYEGYKGRNPNAFTELETNAIGYRLLSQGQIQEAIRVFQLNAEDYPQSWNVYDSLAEGYMNAGQNDLAIQYYEKSIELNPGNTNGIAMLEKLGAR